MIRVTCDFCGLEIRRVASVKVLMSGVIDVEYELCKTCAEKLVEDIEKKVK